jgi:hypothetical protein
MAVILRFPRTYCSFGPETLIDLGKAYDRASANVSDKPQLGAAREVMAGRIFAAAMKGERDPEQLCQAALRGIAVSA